MTYRPDAGMLDTNTGWRVFSTKENEVVKYDNIHVKWLSAGTYSRNKVFVSANSGLSWKEGSHFYRCYTEIFGVGIYDEEARLKNLAPIYAAREAWKRERLVAQRKALAAETPEQKAARSAEYAERQAKKAAALEEKAGKNRCEAMNTMISLGPNLIKLKEKVDNVCRLMNKGGIDKPIIQHGPKERRLRETLHLLGQFEQHILKCQKRTGVE